MEERQTERLILAIKNLNDKVEQLTHNTEKTTVNLTEYDKSYISEMLHELKQTQQEVQHRQNIKMNIKLEDSIAQNISKQIKNEFDHTVKNELKDVWYLLDDTSKELEKFEDKLNQSYKFFYPTLYGVFIAIIGFLMLFFLQGIVGNLFGDAYYPMIAEKVVESTGFNTLVWYLAYVTPVFSVIFALYLVIRLLLKPKLEDFKYKTTRRM